MIPTLVAATAKADIVSGSRYLKAFGGNSLPPKERRRINELVTAELNERLGLKLTDAFCGFKAYRVPCLAKLHLTEPGYAMPLELWVQAVAAGLTIVEEPVPLVYLEEARSFGGALDDGNKRLQYSHSIIDRSLAAVCDSTPNPSAQGCKSGSE
jgi:dolichol-phosphate mannosyltransferase